jgi:hypothetical protein
MKIIAGLKKKKIVRRVRIGKKKSKRTKKSIKVTKKVQHQVVADDIAISEEQPPWGD